MIQQYKNVSIVYGGNGRKYADALSAKITQIYKEDRYPIKATIINDKILTKELLESVIKLFKDSEFCIIFLTEDDICVTDGNEKTRLRQNVVFELGMALIEIGRERCILLSDFDVKKSSFELPSDMSSLSVKRFNENNFDDVIKNVNDKILKQSSKSIVTGVETDTTPRYDDLLIRKEYRVDYENIFIDKPILSSTHGKTYLENTLTQWIEECESLPNYDEKCIYLLERLGFLPIFGKVPAVVSFMQRAAELIEDYSRSDIDYYHDPAILDFTRNLVQDVIEYTMLKTEEYEDAILKRKYKNLLRDLISEAMPKGVELNPLILVIYHDYVGLTQLRLYRLTEQTEYLEQATESFMLSLKYTSLVDMSMQIWSGFLTYNIARAYSNAGNISEAENYYLKAIKIRSKWIQSSHYTITVRNALSYEYFIAKLNYIDMCRNNELMSPDEISSEYDYMEKELNTYSNDDDKLTQLFYIREQIHKRQKNK